MDELSKGMQVGKYKIIRPLGTGGGGTVYLAEDSNLKKCYALKIGERRMIQEEAERMKLITDRRFPYLVDVVEVPMAGSITGDGNTETMPLGIVMEYIEGSTLEEYIRHHAPLSEQQALVLMKQIAELVGYLHSLRPALIYRDLKPANLILQPDGKVRALDFGASLQGFGRVSGVYSYGTYGYCAPEQRTGEELTPACDIYACGVILFYMLTGIDPAKPPYEIAPLTEVSLTASPVMEEIINTCCRKRPEERYQDGTVLLAKLKTVSTRKEEMKDHAMLAGYYLTLFSTAAYTGWGIYKLFTGSREKASLIIGIIALCMMTYLMRKLILEKHMRKHFIKKREWNLLYTEKKTIGLWMLVMTIFLVTGCIKQEVPERLPVYVSDVFGQNILIRDGCEYETKGDLNFCLPTEEGGYYEIYFYKLDSHHMVEKEQMFSIR